MDWITIIGFLAAACSTVSFMPQAWRIIRTRDTSSISKRMYALTCVGFGLWLTYGVMRGEWPLIVTNAICLVFATFILVMSILPEQGRHKVADALDPSAGDKS